MIQMNALLARVEEGLIIESLSLSLDEAEIALDRRDDERFDSRWMEAFRRVDASKKARGIVGDVDPRVTRLREIAYLKAFQLWKSPDLAGYVSDDFGLIGDALALEFDEPFVNALMQAYVHKVFPCGEQED